MKLATYRDGSRDGQLVVVSRDLSQAHFATGIATRLQQVLDDWNFLSPLLQDLSVTLNQGKARHAFPFEPRQCMAPLPRAFGWVLDATANTPPDAGAPATQPAAAPALLHGASDTLLGPCQDVWLGASAWGLSATPRLAAATGDIGMGADAAQGLDGIRLLLLANVWQLDALAAAEAARGAPLLQGLPAAAFAPVAVTPDELGDARAGGQVAPLLQVALNGRRQPMQAGTTTWHAMRHELGRLLAHLAMTRDLRAGLLVGGAALCRIGGAGGVGAPAGLAAGDAVQLDLAGADGQSVFGAIVQRVAGPPAADGAEPAPQPAADDADPA